MASYLDYPQNIEVTNLFLNHFPIYFSGRDIVIPQQCDIKITFIISQIQIDLSAIVKDIDFALIPILKIVAYLDKWSKPYHAQ
jgi:hypothetical protein